GGSHYFNLTGSKILARVGQISVAFPMALLFNFRPICSNDSLPRLFLTKNVSFSVQRLLAILFLIISTGV
ncbi:hypothetical protein, partial [Prevotella histicola]|uniref:hypothetical protein n=1 Tax=Prevotella histicola TaxID=470565 RepID=UPI001C5D67D5